MFTFALKYILACICQIHWVLFPFYRTCGSHDGNVSDKLGIIVLGLYLTEIFIENFFLSNVNKTDVAAKRRKSGNCARTLSATHLSISDTNYVTSKTMATIFRKIISARSSLLANAGARVTPALCRAKTTEATEETRRKCACCIVARNSFQILHFYSSHLPEVRCCPEVQLRRLWQVCGRVPAQVGAACPTDLW